jgi:outer membrane lipoprotein-sorting protein
MRVWLRSGCKQRIVALLLVVVGLVLPVPAARAAAPDAAGIAKKMKAALEPDRSSTRKLTIVIASSDNEGPTQWVAGQARKRLADGSRILTALLSPDDAKGIAFVIQERTGKPDFQWLYLPTVRRVRKIVPLGAYQTFLSTDFTFGDLGFVSMNSTYKLLGTETHADVWCYKLEETPKQQWNYSRVVSWVAAGTFLPVERDFYDPAKQLWKVERYDQVTQEQGIPTPMRIVMQDVQEKTSSTINVSDVHYDVDLPDTLFDPIGLKGAAGAAVWGGTP